MNPLKVCGLDDGVDVVEPLGEEEAGKVKGREICKKPSRQEVDEHNVNHLPFRSWCATCVAARAKNFRHPDRVYEEGSKEVHLDFFFA